MKKAFLLGMMIVTITGAAFAGNGQIGSVGEASSGMTFSLHGTNNPTSAADGVLLKGTEASTLYDSLSVAEHESPGSDGKVKMKVVYLDGSMPAKKSILGCYRTLATSETECYMGKVN